MIDLNNSMPNSKRIKADYCKENSQIILFVYFYNVFTNLQEMQYELEFFFSY